MPDRVDLVVYSRAERQWVVRLPSQPSPVLALDGSAVYSLLALAKSIDGDPAPTAATPG